MRLIKKPKSTSYKHKNSNFIKTICEVLYLKTIFYMGQCTCLFNSTYPNLVRFESSLTRVLTATRRWGKGHEYDN